ncbi:MAG: GNAT family N-acetyltransferase [Puniceicoccales bacterium]|jgi:GNAT superfamily N-acetyltransferase|nr:GNAT family N-acetyltransferase [Puniceicoccales bacterium]
MNSPRFATVEDVPALIALADALVSLDVQFDPTLDPDYNRSEAGREWFLHLFSDTDACVLVIDDADGKPVAMLIGRIDDATPWRKVRGRLGELEMLCVAPGERSRGLGRELVESFTKWAAQQGASRVWVRVSAANAAAIRFYKRELFADYDVILERTV